MFKFETDLENFTAEELKKYVDFVEEKVGNLNDVVSIFIKDVDNDEVSISWQTKSAQKFERVARITGVR